MIPPLGAWGLTGTPVPLPGGHRNTVLRVGDHVVKSTRRSEAAIAWLLPVLDAAEQAGLRAPRPLRSASGALVVDGWTCEACLPGAPTDPTSIAAQMAAFHSLTQSQPQRPGFASAGALVMAHRGGDIDLTAMPPPLVARLRAAWAMLPNDQTVVHGDLSRGNLLTGADGGVTLVDWDEARVDHPGFDLAQLGQHDPIQARAAYAWEIACCWQIEPDRARALAQVFAE
ncbi:MAG: phosphotransferase [Pseudomonadota bacterium]